MRAYRPRKRPSTSGGPTLNPETVKVTLEFAHADVQAEGERTDALDAKLTNIAAFSGVSLSISGSVGGSVVAAESLSQGFTIALGSVLGVAATLLLSAVIVCFSGLRPKPFRSLSNAGAANRVRRSHLARRPEEAMSQMASTYYRVVLPHTRRINDLKVARVKTAFVLVGMGFGGLATGLILIVIGSTT